MTINLTDPANHPANGPLTAERIKRVIEALEISLKYSNGSSMDHVLADAVKGLRELREVRKARPIHQVMYGELWRDITEEQYHDHAIHESPIRIVYAAPPAPVVPDAYIRDERQRMMLNGKCEPKIGFAAGWNACRAAMLQAGNSPPTPDGWVMVPIVPTMEMLDEFDSIIDYGVEDSNDAWSRLISVAPKEVG